MWGPNGKCTAGKVIRYQDMCIKMMHNVAEVWAASNSLAYLEAKGYMWQHSRIVLQEDSQLTINFMLRKYKPGPRFCPMMKAMLNQCNEWKKQYRVQVHWEHMPREQIH